jgi:urea carboxylase
MKMEISIAATVRGIVRVLQVKPGQTLRAGDLVCALEEV